MENGNYTGKPIKNPCGKKNESTVSESHLAREAEDQKKKFEKRIAKVSFKLTKKKGVLT